MHFCLDTKEKTSPSDALIIPFTQVSKGKDGPRAVFAAKGEFPEIKAVLASGDFLAKEGECYLVYREKDQDKRLFLLGLGKEESLTEESLRKAYGAAAKNLRKKRGCKRVRLLVPSIKKLTKEAALSAAIEGLLIGSYTYDAMKKESLKDDIGVHIEEVLLAEADKKALSIAERLGKIHQSTKLTKDLVNANADDVTPQMLCRVAKEIAKEFPTVKTVILDKKAIQKLSMGLLLAVNQGAAQEPAVILMEYKGNPKSSEYTAIVGKGITYDTGGLNIKPTGSMETMKCDMAGAATVLGLMQAVAMLKLPVNIVGSIATTENAIGPLSYKPGDVYKSYSGKTVEITNTDAEGRLVLADVISYVQDRYKLKRLVDLATLTGAIVVALGEEATGLFCNKDDLAKALIASGEKTFERLWRMPIYQEYRDQLKSSIADIKNSGSRKAGSATAAIFLKDFIKDDLPWAHLDIAGTAYLSEARGYHTTPATAIGVRLLLDFLSAHP